MQYEAELEDLLDNTRTETEHAHAETASPYLPADFRLHLLTYERIKQLEKLMQHVIENQHATTLQLHDLFRNTFSAQAETQRQIMDSVIEVVQRSKEEVISNLKKYHRDMTMHPPCTQSQQWTHATEIAQAKRHSEAQWRMTDDALRVDDDPTSSSVDFHSQAFLFTKSRLARHITKETVQAGSVRSFVRSHRFDMLSAAVIVVNSVFIGMNAQSAIQHALANTRDPNDSQTRVAVFFFSSFYCMELLLRIWAFRCLFFTGPDWQWNALDMLLVTTGVHDMITTAFSIDLGQASVTGMRLLRLLKTLKIFRVVRVMRFFRELRVMLESIFGSIATLFWSITMLSIVVYVFGLCFLQAVTGYLEGTSSVDSKIKDQIRTYWSSVFQAAVTLYMAITGGADWEQLAEPVKASGSFFYVLFLFYISFAAVAVLNVLTGLYVESAKRKSDVCDTRSLAELIMKEHTILHDFERLFYKIDAIRKTGLMTWDEFHQVCHLEEVQEVLKALEIKKDAFKKVFDALQVDGSVKLDEFLVGCCKHRDDIKLLDTIGLTYAHRRTHSQMAQLMQYVQERFDEMTTFFSVLGAPPSKTTPLANRLVKAHCLPAQWDITVRTQHSE